MRECRRVADLLGAYVYGDLSPEESSLVDSHIADCRSCYEELEARARAVSLVPNEAPKLTDDERMRVMWSVKGAVRANRPAERTPFFARASVWGFATVAIVAVAFAAGVLYGPKPKPPKVIVKQGPIKEKPIVKSPPPPTSLPAPVAEQPPQEIPGPTINQPIIISPDMFAFQPAPRDRVAETYRGKGQRKKPEEVIPEDPRLSPVPSNFGLSPLLGLSEDDAPQISVPPMLMSPDGSTSEPSAEDTEPKEPDGGEVMSDER